ncbi:MAG: hypothetical protein IMZ61_10905 [Planctomycetes bacterium]|nr:hypothetical protein [Planctomycetota bacterium]
MIKPMTKTQQVEAAIEANSLKAVLGFYSPDLDHFGLYIRNGSITVFYGTYTKAIIFLKGFAAGISAIKYHGVVV